MTLQEYYKFPEGSNVNMSFLPFWLCEKPYFACPANMSDAFDGYKGSYIPPLDTSNVTNMNNMFSYCANLKTLTNIYDFDTSNVTNMRYMFRNSGLEVVVLDNWDTSKVTDMGNMFDSCSSLQRLDMSKCDTSKVTNMSYMIGSCSKVVSFAAIDCSGISTKNNYPFQLYSDNSVLRDVGGFLNMKMSWDNAYGLAKYTNLTYESCINILNGLYDFTGNGETPNSNQGTLKVHSNFLTTVGDEISIGVNKGWTITT